MKHKFNIQFEEKLEIQEPELKFIKHSLKKTHLHRGISISYLL